MVTSLCSKVIPSGNTISNSPDAFFVISMTEQSRLSSIPFLKRSIEISDGGFLMTYLISFGTCFLLTETYWILQKRKPPVWLLTALFLTRRSPLRVKKSFRSLADEKETSKVPLGSFLQLDGEISKVIEIADSTLSAVAESTTCDMMTVSSSLSSPGR